MNPTKTHRSSVPNLVSMLMLALVVTWPADLRAEVDVPDQMVLVGPTGSLREQIEYLRKTWPTHYAIAVVEATEEPECHPFIRSDGGPSDQISCFVRVQFNEVVDGTEEVRPRIHYPHIAGNDITNIATGRRILAFLVAGRMFDLYVCIVMMRATEENLLAVRAALREIDG